MDKLQFLVLIEDIVRAVRHNIDRLGRIKTIGLKVSLKSGRSYCAVVGGVSSKDIHITCWVPQGWVLGRSSSLYVADL